MINIDTIEQEILNLEKRDTSYATIERLAWLYIVYDHLKGEELTGDIVGGDFCKACSGVPINSLMQVLSEHMDAINLLYPKEYQNIIQRINDIR